MHNIEVSIIIPTYNRKDMLRECLDSLFNQTYPEDKYEIIIIDDGSTDGTEEFIKQLQQKNQNLRYLKQHNQGPATARNLGIKHAQGEICVFTDSDCLAPANFLEEIMKCFKDHPGIAACVGNVTPLFRNKLFLPLSDYYKMKHKSKKDTVFSQLTPAARLRTDCCAIKKDVFLKMDGFDTKFIWPAGEDIDLGFRMLKNGYKICFANTILVYHYQRDTIRKLFVRFYKCEIIDTINFKVHFKNWFVLKLPFKKLIYFSHFPISFYLQIGHFEFLTFAFFMLFFYFLVSLTLLAGYVLIIYGGIRNINILAQLLLYEYLTGFGCFAGRVAGSIKNKIFYL